MHVDGSPATCVNLALYSLVPDVDLVISGPNVGHNVGRCGAMFAQLIFTSVQHLATQVSALQHVILCKHVDHIGQY